jgi:hypothetical protein
MPDGFAWRSSSLLADRFLSLCAGLPRVIPERIGAIADSLSLATSSFTIGKDHISSPFIQPLVLAIAYGREIRHLELADLTVSGFLPWLPALVQANSTIRRVTFSRCAFNGSLQTFVNVWAAKTAFAANKFVFRDCTVAETDFATFLRGFERYPADLHSFSVDNCNLSVEQLTALYGLFPRCPCFRTLAKLAICGVPCVSAHVPLIAAFLGSPFVTEHKHLAKLVLALNGFSAPLQLTEFLRRDTRISTLNLSGNVFPSSVVVDFRNFRQLQLLSLGGCTFSSNSLLAFLQAVSAASPSPPGLILDGLRLPAGEWVTVYSGLPDLTLPQLHLFSWSRNRMGAVALTRFLEFVKKQPQLENLALSDAIDPAEAGRCCDALAGLATGGRLERLELAAAADPLGAGLHGLLAAFRGSGTLRSLDVTGQALGDAGLALLADLAQGGVRVLRFDGNKPSSHEALVALAARLTASALEVCEWPERDASECLAAVPPGPRRQAVRAVTAAKEKFALKFGGSAAITKTELPAVTVDQAPGPVVPVAHRRSGSLFQMAHGSGALAKQKQQLDQDILGFRDQEVVAAIAEVLGAESLKDPLFVIFREMEESTAIDTLLAD